MKQHLLKTTLRLLLVVVAAYLLPMAAWGVGIIKYIYQPVDILIDGVVKNSEPVGNEVVVSDGIKVWTAKGYLHVSIMTEQTIRIYNLTGSLVKQAIIPAGSTQWQLPSCIYIVQIDTIRYKVIL